ncbi:MAG: hypothetical protein ACOZCL_10370 [Bacillota bacterium]
MYIDKEKLLVIGALIGVAVVFLVLYLTLNLGLEIEFSFAVFAVISIYIINLIMGHIRLMKGIEEISPLELHVKKQGISILDIINAVFSIFALQLSYKDGFPFIPIAILFAVHPIVTFIYSRFSYGISQRGILTRSGYYSWEDLISFNMEKDDIIKLEVKHRVLFIIYNKELLLQVDKDNKAEWERILTKYKVYSMESGVLE